MGRKVKEKIERERRMKARKKRKEGRKIAIVLQNKEMKSCP